MIEDDTALCRYCQQPVHPEAVKCQHCGEFISASSSFEQVSKKTLAYIGLLTALLSLFYALKEGYFYIEERKQKRITFTSYISAAERFQKLGNLDYAEAALQQAIVLNPTDRQLQLRHFLVRSQALLREADYYGMQLPDKYIEPVSEIVTNGFSLLNGGFTRGEQAKVLIFLGRLLQYDRRWSDKDEISTLFAEARQLVPDDATTAFWYGQWLLYEKGGEEEALVLINQAVRSEPDNARYWLTLGEYQQEKGMYREAFESFMTAIKLGPRKSELEYVRAVNEAKSSLSRALLNADAVMDITSPDFFSLSMERRNALVDFALEHCANDRRLQLLAARFFYTVERFEDADVLVRKSLGSVDEGSKVATLELFAAILEARGTDPETLAEIRVLLAVKQKRTTVKE